jgi:hypothetical protein
VKAARRLLLVALLLTCGSGSALAAITEIEARNAVIMLQHGPCERRCAVDDMILLGDGTAIYVGRHFARLTGVRSFEVAARKIFDLLAQAEAAGFFASDAQHVLAARACTGPANEDAPTDRLAITVDGRAVAITVGHRCAGAESPALTALEHEVEALFTAGLRGKGGMAPNNSKTPGGRSP